MINMTENEIQQIEDDWKEEYFYLFENICVEESNFYGENRTYSKDW